MEMLRQSSSPSLICTTCAPLRSTPARTCPSMLCGRQDQAFQLSGPLSPSAHLKFVYARRVAGSCRRGVLPAEAAEPRPDHQRAAAAGRSGIRHCHRFGFPGGPLLEVALACCLWGCAAAVVRGRCCCHVHTYWVCGLPVPRPAPAGAAVTSCGAAALLVHPPGGRSVCCACAAGLTWWLCSCAAVWDHLEAQNPRYFQQYNVTRSALVRRCEPAPLAMRSACRKICSLLSTLHCAGV